MTKEANLGLRDLIAASIAAGTRRSELARVAGCSRVHLWRIETGRAKADSRAAIRLREALEAPDALRRELAAAVDACVASNDRRGRLLLQLLHTLRELNPPGGTGSRR